MPTQDASADHGRILVIDDEPVVADVLHEVLARDGYEIRIAEDAYTGRQELESAGWDALLLDVMLPDENGMDLLRWVRERSPDLAVVISRRPRRW